MKKRILCFLTAAVLALWAAPAFACDHTQDGEPVGYVLRNHVEPQVGVEGYSGDFCCPLCGAVMVPGQSLPALQPPAGPSDGTGDTVGDGGQTLPETPAEEEKKEETPAEPAAPAEPAQPEIPAQPETPVQPETPTQPEAPVQPETPAQPEAPAQPAAAEPQPETPAQPEAPAQPAAAETQAETPAQPEAPAGPAAGSEAAAEPASPAAQEAAPAAEDSGADLPAVAPAEEADSEYIAPADDTPASSGGSSGGAAAGKSDRDIVSENYPYRRVLMHPEPGIRAEAAGTLLWPLPSSPFQQLLNN